MLLALLFKNLQIARLIQQNKLFNIIYKTFNRLNYNNTQPQILKNKINLLLVENHYT